MVFSSKLIEEAVAAFNSLPGIGKKTALRMVLHLLKEDKNVSEKIGDAIIKMRNEIKFCEQCNNISDQKICNICADSSRDQTIICVVENIRDVITIENTGQYNGLYHVLGGLLSPLDGIGPEQLYLQQLIERAENHSVKEIIMALSPNIEGDTTVFYISKLIKNKAIIISGIARGVAFGGELEYTDDITLAKSIARRLPVDLFVKNEF